MTYTAALYRYRILRRRLYYRQITPTIVRTNSIS